MNPLISKARRPKFELTLRIIDLNNVPLVSGTSYIKWHLPSSTSAEHRGRTDKSLIKEHKVSWDYVRTIPVRLTIDKNNNLQECLIHFEILQDYSSGARGEKITLGYITLNLAEYVEESEDGEEGVTRRYLMQESKINSTLKVSIAMKQIDGERNFVAPPLKTAAVFGGIAGIMAGEQGEPDDMGHLPMPQISKSRDHSELQDMYRRALAASWASQPGELPADQCVEEIFAGGDGWKPDSKDAPRITHDSANISGEDLRHHGHGHSHRGHRRTESGASSKSQSTVTGKSAGRFGHKHSRSKDTIDHGTGISNSPNDTLSESSDRGRTGFRKANEVDEMEIRDDLIAWRLPGGVND